MTFWHEKWTMGSSVYLGRVLLRGWGRETWVFNPLVFQGVHNRAITHAAVTPNVVCWVPSLIALALFYEMNWELLQVIQKMDLRGILLQVLLWKAKNFRGRGKMKRQAKFKKKRKYINILRLKFWETSSVIILLFSWKSFMDFSFLYIRL